MSNARDQKDGLVVVTVFIETKVMTNNGFVDVRAPNPALTPIVSALPRVKQFQNRTTIEDPIYLADLIPGRKDVFYEYEGSLTTPPCSQTATFLIFDDPIYITRQQVILKQKILRIDGQGSSRTRSHSSTVD